MITALLLPLTAMQAEAHEGMWLPDQLPLLAEELKKQGATMPADRLAKVDKGPLAAMVDLDDRCSGAFVSADGLIATAYHCVGEAMRHASDRGENLFETGFYAADRKDERWAGPTFSVKVTLSMEDVTEEVLAGTKKVEPEERQKRIDNHTRALEKRCERPGVHCEVIAFDQGASYKLVAQQEFKDVRVVYTPPRSVGYYGGDADNWQWPRHSGDFAFLRAYADSENRPTAYRADNAPFKPAAFLPPAKQAPEAGGFVMVAGYPSGTYRWKSAAEIDFARDSAYPRRIATLADVLEILNRFAEQDERTANIVDPRILSLNNQMQYMQGNLDAFRRIDANRRKWRFERDLAAWIAEDPARTAQYGTVLDTIHRLQAEESSTAARDHVATQLRSHSVMFDTGLKLYRLAKESNKRDADRAKGFQERDRPAFADGLDAVDERYAFKVDMAITRYFLDRLLSLPDSMRIPELDNWFASQRGETYDERLENAITRLYTSGADLSDPARRRALMDTSVWYLERSGNPWFELSAALLPYYERLEGSRATRNARWAEV
ncbi:MAG: S46 family peptidase, partial [Alphaproteobacteria bacterium]|nr:S46 family peptidase [Alphaproteobacteria bacterium]